MNIVLNSGYYNMSLGTINPSQNIIITTPYQYTKLQYLVLGTGESLITENITNLGREIDIKT